MDSYSPESELDPAYVRQQEELLRQFQQPSPTPTASSTTSSAAPFLPPHQCPYPQPYPVESASALQQRSGSASRTSYSSSDVGSDHVVRGAGEGGGAFTKVAMPVQVEEEGEGGVGGLMAQHMQQMGLKDAVGDESVVNPVYLMSKYQGGNREESGSNPRFAIPSGVQEKKLRVSPESNILW